MAANSHINAQKKGGAMSTAWSRCLEVLESELSDQDCNAWIRPLRAVEQGESLELLAPNPFIQEHVQNHFIPTIERALYRSGSPIQNIVIGNHVLAAQGAITAFTQPMQPKLESRLNPFFTFDTFVDSSSTQLAHAASLHVAERHDNSYNPLFIYGTTGLGKTHLMNAIGHAILQKKPDSRILYASSERFVSGFIGALRHKKMDQFKELYRSLDVLLIDDIQFFARKESSQEEFLNTYNLLLDGNKQIVLTSDRYPKEIKELDNRLQSRFSAGMSFEVKPPKLDVRVAILMKKAEQLAVDLPEDVALDIAKMVKSNIRELEGAFNNVRAQAHLTGNPITMESARKALSGLIAVQGRRISTDNIQKTVAEYYNVSLSDLLSKSRSRSVVHPRHIAMYLAKELTEKSLPEIASTFGNRNHTTVMHAYRKIKGLLETDLKIREDCDELKRLLS